MQMAQGKVSILLDHLRVTFMHSQQRPTTIQQWEEQLMRFFSTNDMQGLLEWQQAPTDRHWLCSLLAPLMKSFSMPLFPSYPLSPVPLISKLYPSPSMAFYFISASLPSPGGSQFVSLRPQTGSFHCQGLNSTLKVFKTCTLDQQHKHCVGRF